MTLKAAAEVLVIELSASKVKVAVVPAPWMSMPAPVDEPTSRLLRAMVPVASTKRTPVPVPVPVVPTSVMVALALALPRIARPAVAAMSRPRTALPLASSMTSPVLPSEGAVPAATRSPPPAYSKPAGSRATSLPCRTWLFSSAMPSPVLATVVSSKTKMVSPVPSRPSSAPPASMGASEA